MHLYPNEVDEILKLRKTWNHTSILKLDVNIHSYNAYLLLLLLLIYYLQPLVQLKSFTIKLEVPP